MHLGISNLTIIGSENGLAPSRRQAIISTNAGILLIWTSGTYFSEILIEIQTFSFKKVHFKLSSAKWRPGTRGLGTGAHFMNDISIVIKILWKIGFSVTSL